jgi:hypothetical protein
MLQPSCCHPGGSCGVHPADELCMPVTSPAS